MKYLWESKKHVSPGRFTGADWNAPRYCMVDVMKRYGLAPDLLSGIIAHAFTCVRIFPVHGICNPATPTKRSCATSPTTKPTTSPSA